jgi:hypothetical protein
MEAGTVAGGVATAEAIEAVARSAVDFAYAMARVDDEF